MQNVCIHVDFFTVTTLACYLGDCYVAVTGVPDARKDHAVILAQFADECRSKTNQVIAELINELGPSVGKLSIRTGLHSGSVTAGVLRGLKSRFELFGGKYNIVVV